MVENKTAEPTAAELMSKIAAAGASGDLAEVIRLGNILRKQKSEIEKAETEKLQKEAEALAGDRSKLVERHLNTGKYPTDKELQAVKATGFTYKVTAPDANGVDVKAHIALTVPTVKAKKSGGGGGARVSTKDETGMGLSEFIEHYATAEQKVAIQTAYDTAEKSKGSAKWQEQKKVKTEILKVHPELVLK